MTNPDTVTIALGTAHFKEANEWVREALDRADGVELEEVYAQRYLGCAMPAGKCLEIHGIPGNDLGSYMDGGSIEVFGNAQDQVGNTMNAGRIIIHGRAGDAAGYGLRGGEIFIRDGCGWRAGIHMKQYEQKRPVLVIGGDAGCFLGEYMAGGVIVLLGKAADHIATGMHGGVIYVASPPEPERLPEELVMREVEEEDLEVLVPLLHAYAELFGEELEKPIDVSGKGFWKLIPASSRPYADMYVK